MGNHFHLLIRDRSEQVSDFMHLLGTTYGRRFNDRHGRDGPLFRGRFHSVVIATDVQLLRTLRYVHLNPVDITSLERLEEFRWSSHRAYLRLRRCPDWLVVDQLLDRFDGVDGYRRFVVDEAAPQDVDVDRSDVEVATAIALADVELASGSFDGVVRDVGFVLIDRHPRLEPTPLDPAAVSGTSSSAIRSARSRARKRLNDDPTFVRLVERVELVLQLGPVPRCNGYAERSSPARSWAA